MRRIGVVCGFAVLGLVPAQSLTLTQGQGLAAHGQAAPAQGATAAVDRHPAALVAIAKEFRDWRRKKEGVPDYAAYVTSATQQLAHFRQQLEALPVQSWPAHAQVDYLVVRSEIDDLDFDLRVVRQASRNPDYYTTEAVERVAHLIGGRYQYGPGVTVPYDAKRAEAIVRALNDTSAIVAQGPKNLTEGVGAMADMALERLKDIKPHYQEFARSVGPHLPEPYRAQIGPAADAAGDALAKYGTWIQANRAKMTAPVPIGRKAFEWYARRVLMIPYDSEQLLTLAESERTRSWAFLEFERLKNRALPVLRPAKTNAEFAEWKDATDLASRKWAEQYGLFTAPDYVGRMGDQGGGIWIEPFGLLGFPKTPLPAGTKTEFLVEPDHWFADIYWERGHRVDPGTNHPHSDYPGHSFENAVSQRTTCELRKGHNTRGDAWTTYMEELQLQLDYPFVRGARVREWMYSLAIMRAERLYVAVKFADGSLTPEQVAQHYLKAVPGMEPYVAKKHEVWRKFADPAQVLTYQVGKTEIYKFMTDEMKRLGDKFDLRAFNDALLASGQIPVTLARFELTGLDDDVRGLWTPVPMPTGNAPETAASR